MGYILGSDETLVTSYELQKEGNDIVDEDQSIQYDGITGDKVLETALIQTNANNGIETQKEIPYEEGGYGDSNEDNIPLAQLREKFISNVTAGYENNNNNNELNYTKSGTIRKRKKFDTDLKTRNFIKRMKVADKHTVLPGCDNSCKQKCSTISEQQRENLNRNFWKLLKIERKTYLLNSCERLQVARRTTESSRKQNTFKYFLHNENGARIRVCKTFYLTTLGYKKSNDRILHDTLSKTPKGQSVPLSHGNLQKTSNRKIDDGDINSHIESFNPCISHYRREHSPHVRYLSSDITITLMYKDFQEKYPATQLSYETYRKKLK